MTKWTIAVIAAVALFLLGFAIVRAGGSEEPGIVFRPLARSLAPPAEPLPAAAAAAPEKQVEPLKDLQDGLRRAASGRTVQLHEMARLNK